VTGQFHNRTRRSRSIPRSLARRGRFLDIPLYYLLRTSDLAREGLDHSGSYRFADHIYRGVPSGRGAFGRWLDSQLLQLPATRAFKYRYLAAREELVRFLIERATFGSGASTDVLSVPCGIPRELADAAADVAEQLGSPPAWVVLHGLDLDDSALAVASGFMRDRNLGDFKAVRGDALDRRAYGGPFDFITCTGLTEFLNDRDAAQLYALLFDVLRYGGRFVTSGMKRRWASDYLLRLGELHAHYRDEAALRQLLAPLPFRDVSTRTDDTGLQTVVVARK
jgi:Methyltransferase domain